MSYPPPYPPGSPGGPPASAPYGHGTPAWPHPWTPPGVRPPGPPPRRPWARGRVALLVGGITLGVAVLAVVVVAGLRVGRDGAPALAGAAGGGGASGPVSTAPPSDPAGLGDDPGLDGYAQRCHDGLMSACDDLYALADVLSGYEQYGVTCGGRVKAASLASCTELDDD